MAFRWQSAYGAEEVEVIERNIRQKVVAPDFRYPMQDGRLSLARLCALRGCYDEAADWFGKSRAVLEEQGARPLRAIADLDEAIMYLRRNEDGDRHRAGPLLAAATMRFRALGMTGWLRRARESGRLIAHHMDYRGENSQHQR